MPTMTVAPPPAAGRDDGSQGARRPRGASRCASQPLRAPRPCKHGSLRPRGTPAHRCAPHSLCATRAKFCAGQPRCLDELIFCFVLRDAAALLIVSIFRRCILRPAHCTSPARMSPCAAPQRAMQAKRARACCETCTCANARTCHCLARFARARSSLPARACGATGVDIAGLNSQPPWTRTRDLGKIATKSCEQGLGSQSRAQVQPAEREPSRAHASSARAVSSMPCRDTSVRRYTVACTVLCCSCVRNIVHYRARHHGLCNIIISRCDLAAVAISPKPPRPHV